MDKQNQSLNTFLYSQLPFLDTVRSFLGFAGAILLTKNLFSLYFDDLGDYNIYGMIFFIVANLVLISDSIRYFYLKEKMFKPEITFWSFIKNLSLIKIFLNLLFVGSLIVGCIKFYNIFVLVSFKVTLTDCITFTTCIAYICLWLFYLSDDYESLFKKKESEDNTKQDSNG